MEPIILNRDSPFAQGLVAWYPAGNPACWGSDTWLDMSGFGHHHRKTSAGGFTWTGIGKPETRWCVDLNATTGTWEPFAERPKSNLFDFGGGGVTLMGWVRWIGSQQNYAGLWNKLIVSPGSPPYNNCNLQLHNNSSRKLRFAINIGESEKVLQGSTTPSKNVWYHVAATYNGSHQRVYLNGDEDGQRSQTGSIVVEDTETRIGAFPGAKDDIRIYNRPLTAEEIAMVFGDTSGGGYGDLLYTPSKRRVFFIAPSGGPVSVSVSPVPIDWSPQSPTTDLSHAAAVANIHWDPQAVTTDLSHALTNANIHWSPQAVTTDLATLAAVASIHWDPQSITTGLGQAMSVVNIHWSPQTVSHAGITVSPDVANVHWISQTVATDISASMTAANVRWNLQTIETALNLSVSPANIDWDPKTPTTALLTSVDPISVHWTPLSAATQFTQTLSAAAIHWTPQTLTTAISHSVSPVPIHWTAITVSITGVVQLQVGAVTYERTSLVGAATYQRVAIVGAATYERVN